MTKSIKNVVMPYQEDEILTPLIDEEEEPAEGGEETEEEVE